MKRSNPLVARAVALLASVVLVAGLVPVPSLAEAVAEVEGQEQASVEEGMLAMWLTPILLRRTVTKRRS